MNNEWLSVRLSDLCMTEWNRVADLLDYAHRPYVYSQYNYGFIANRPETIHALIDLYGDRTSIAADTIRRKLEELL